MNLEAALEERDMKASELIRKSGVSAPTVYHMTGTTWDCKTGVKTETLAKIAKVLDAQIVVNETKPYYFDIILRDKNENS